jgi:hypothetical protein
MREKQKCKDCKFYKSNNLSGDVEKFPPGIGRCYRYPPVNGESPTTLQSHFEWPGVPEHGWCGEWKPIDDGEQV